MVGPEASVPAVQQNNAGSVVGAMEIAHCGIAEGRKTFSFSEEKEEMLVLLCICRQSSFELASSYDSAFRLIQLFFLNFQQVVFKLLLFDLSYELWVVDRWGWAFGPMSACCWSDGDMHNVASQREKHVQCQYAKRRKCWCC